MAQSDSILLRGISVDTLILTMQRTDTEALVHWQQVCVSSHGKSRKVKLASEVFILTKANLADIITGNHFGVDLIFSVFIHQ